MIYIQIASLTQSFLTEPFAYGFFHDKPGTSKRLEFFGQSFDAQTHKKVINLYIQFCWMFRADFSHGFSASNP